MPAVLFKGGLGYVTEVGRDMERETNSETAQTKADPPRTKSFSRRLFTGLIRLFALQTCLATKKGKPRTAGGWEDSGLGEDGRQNRIAFQTCFTSRFAARPQANPRLYFL